MSLKIKSLIYVTIVTALITLIIGFVSTMQNHAMLLFVFLLVVGFGYLVFMIFLQKEFLSPLHQLQYTLESMMHDTYKPNKIKNDDEIAKVFQKSNEVFKHFWKYYSTLDSYQKTINKANLITKTDLKGKITFANELFCTTSRYELDEVIAKPHNIVRHPDMDPKIFKQMWETIQSGHTWRGEIKNRKKDGGYYWADAVITPIYGIDGNIEGYMSVRRDITELMDSKHELEYLANYDLLTNLGSRDKLNKDIQIQHNLSLILINIDRFSQINDFYGHAFGDKLLQAFTHRLSNQAQSLINLSPKLYRNGGDEFAILLNTQKNLVVDFVDKILFNLEKQPFIIDDKELNLNLSCGISFENKDELLLSADMALKLSKAQKKNYVIYTVENSLNEKYRSNLEWAAKLKMAIEEDRIVPFFQPIVNNQTLKVQKYEALVRIVENDGKVISPFFFLDIAKQTKQYLQITKIMIEKSFALFQNNDLEFSLNLTMEDIADEEISHFIFDSLAQNPDIAKRLVFELVESESVGNYELIIAFIQKVKSYGCKVAIDDFGSGYSNFEYLIKMKCDYIKIDGSLIKHIATKKESFIVVSTIVDFAKKMKIETIAEFIEDETILQKVQELGIDYSQGYYFSPPQEKIGSIQ